MNRHIKRVHVEPQPPGGIWVSVGPLLARGPSPSETQHEVTSRAIASSANVRRWFGYTYARGEGFRGNHFAELSAREEMLNKVHKRIWHERATTVDRVRDSTFNNARALAEHLSRKR